MLSLRNESLAGGLILLVIGSAALFGLGPAALADSHATEIGCTTIEDPGLYHLTSDLSGHEGTCIQILADDVTVDGQGHTISGAQSGVVMDDIYNNVTVRNLNIRGMENNGIWLAEGSDHTIRNVDIRNVGGNAISLGQGAYGVDIDDLTLVANNRGLFLGMANDVTVDNAVIRDNTETGIILYDYSDLQLQDATISGNGVGISAELGGAVNATGISLQDNGVGILVEQDHDSVLLGIHRSVIAGNDVAVRVDRFYQSHIINLTHNYWGASDGPSSAGDEPVADPVTGAFANGSGDSIGGIDGEAVARFDPWLASEGGELPTTTDPTTETSPTTEETTADSTTSDPTTETETQTDTETNPPPTTTAPTTNPPTTVKTTETVVTTTTETPTTVTPTTTAETTTDTETVPTTTPLTTEDTATMAATPTTTEETAAGTPQTDTASETVGAQPTTKIETDTAETTETGEETTTTFEEGTAPIGGTTTTTETGAPGIPGFGVGGGARGDRCRRTIGAAFTRIATFYRFLQ